MKGRPWLGFVGSAALHASVVALALVLLRSEEPLPALIIDLRDPFVAGSASVRPPEEENRPAPSARAPRSRRAKTDVAAPARQPTPSPRSAPPVPASEPAPAPRLAPVVEAPPASAPPPAPVVQAPPAQLALAQAPTSEPAGVAGGSGASTSSAGSASARSASGGSVSGGSASGGATGPAPTGFNHGAGGSREGSGATGPAVAAVPPGGSGGGVVGSGAGAGAAEYGPYLTALRQRIQQSLRYPARARRRGVAGTVNVEILILPNGTIGGVTLLESSSHPVLDEAALDTIRSLPRMPLPSDLPARPLRVRVPVVFQMR